MTIAYVQSTGNASSAQVTSLTASLSGVVAGDYLLLAVIGRSTGLSAPQFTASDPNNGSYTVQGSYSHSYSKFSNASVYFLSVLVVTGGSITVTVSTVGALNSYISFGFYEVSVDPGYELVLDLVSSGANGSSLGPACTSISISSGDFVLAGYDVVTTGLTYSNNTTGFTLGYTQNGGSSEGCVTQYAANVTTTPIAPAITLSSSSLWLALAVSYKEMLIPVTDLYQVDSGSSGDIDLSGVFSSEFESELDSDTILLLSYDSLFGSDQSSRSLQSADTGTGGDMPSLMIMNYDPWSWADQDAASRMLTDSAAFYEMLLTLGIQLPDSAYSYDSDFVSGYLYNSDQYSSSDLFMGSLLQSESGSNEDLSMIAYSIFSNDGSQASDLAYPISSIFVADYQATSSDSLMITIYTPVQTVSSTDQASGSDLALITLLQMEAGTEQEISYLFSYFYQTETDGIWLDL